MNLMFGFNEDEGLQGIGHKKLFFASHTFKFRFKCDSDLKYWDDDAKLGTDDFSSLQKKKFLNTNKPLFIGF